MRLPIVRSKPPPRKIFVRGRDKRVGVFAEETQVDVTLDLEAAGIVEYPDGSIIPTALSAAVPLLRGRPTSRLSPLYRNERNANDRRYYVWVD
ncbi:MAG: hypothetical protein IJO46_11680, partial [Thermoguttaceae bacterium]|nr:hypothetical protein [Thermoguttaceae bacterium]